MADKHAGDRHVLTVPGRYEEIKHVCQFVAGGAEQAGLDEADIFHVELACDEACTNVIEHAYGGENVGDIFISWQIRGDCFTITIHDNGRAFDPEEVAGPPPLENLKAGGLGLHFMRTLMDDVRFTFDKQTGNTLVMVKKISGEET